MELRKACEKGIIPKNAAERIESTEPGWYSYFIDQLLYDYKDQLPKEIMIKPLRGNEYKKHEVVKTLVEIREYLFALGVGEALR